MRDVIHSLNEEGMNDSALRVCSLTAFAWRSQITCVFGEEKNERKRRYIRNIEEERGRGQRKKEKESERKRGRD